MHSDSEATATPLFRHEAMKFQAAGLQGEVLLKIRSPWLVVGFTCVALAVAVIAAAALISYDRKARTTGVLVSGVLGHVEAQLRIAPSVIGFIKRGQGVRLRYDAFPDRSFHLAEGKIISASLMPAADGSYRAQVALERDYVQVSGVRIALQPGMSFTGDVVIERRSLLEWLFEPLYASGAQP